MHHDVIRAEVIALTRRVEADLPDRDGLHAASRRLREIIANIGNAAARIRDEERSDG